jgi:hypothetical protein
LMFGTVYEFTSHVRGVAPQRWAPDAPRSIAEDGDAA